MHFKISVLIFFETFIAKAKYLDFGLTNIIVKYVLHIFSPSENLWQVHPSVVMLK